MKLGLFSGTVKADVVVIDSTFPQKEPFGFRNTEINEYFRRTKSIGSYAMYPMEPWGDAWFPWSYGLGEKTYSDNREGYLRYYPENASRIHYIDENKKYKFKLAYSYFLAETYVLLPFYEKNNIPFVFMLYPGGTFGIDNASSDKMLKRVFASSCFRGVIVSQKLTEEYLVAKKLCPNDKIHFVFGGFSQFRLQDIKKKKYYKKDKQTFDICFVAGNYSERGKDKGYDLFVAVAIELAKSISDVRFHVVGNFSPKDVSLEGVRDMFTFYGYRKPTFLAELYSKMDIYLSPNRPGVLYEGNFDGFPLGIDTSYCGVAQFASDPLNMNRGSVEDGKDIVIVPLEAKGIAKKILYYYSETDRLYELARRGQLKAQKLFDIDYQVSERMKIFEALIKQEIK